MCVEKACTDDYIVSREGRLGVNGAQGDLLELYGIFRLLVLGVQSSVAIVILLFHVVFNFLNSFW